VPDHDPPLPAGDAPRPMPLYAGRDTSSTSAGEVLLWVPRVVLFPAYVVSEFVIRRPVGAVLTFAEEHRVQERWDDFFRFGEERKIGLFPTGAIDLGFRPTVGLYFFWDDMVGQSDFKLRVTSGGIDSWSVNTLFRLPLDAGARLDWTLDYSKLPDRAFHGLSTDAHGDAARYEEERLDGRATYSRPLGKFGFSSYAGLLAVAFDATSGDLGDPSLADAIAAGRFAPPPALEDGILVFYQGIGARFDTRPPRLSPPPRSIEDLEPRSGSGFAASAHVEHDAGLKRTRASTADLARLPQWLSYGGSLTGALDVTGTRRTLELETMAEFAEALPGDNSVPFTEQVPLGGSFPMRAFRAGRLVDLSAAVATLRYRWPIWEALDGALHYAVGNVFGEHLNDFEFERLRSSFGAGIHSADSLDHPFEILIAFGTKTFGEGASIESVRFVFGTRARF